MNFDKINTVNILKKDVFELAIKSEESREFLSDLHNISVGLSSGTSGNKGIFLSSQREKEMWVGSILDRVIGLQLKKRKVAFFLRANNNLYEFVKSALLSFTFFDLKKPLSKSIENLTLLKPDILVAQPSVLIEIAKHYSKEKVRPTFNKIISVAEVLEDDQKKYFESVFNCQIDQVYQCTEGFLAYTCKKGKLHFNEDWLKIEKKYIDDEKNRFHPIITDYLRESQPIVRYELNDIIHEGKSCNCGSKSIVIKKIEGRSDDVFKFEEKGNEVIIYPDFIRRAIIANSSYITNYVVILVDKMLINVYLEISEGTNIEDEFKKVKNGLDKMMIENGLLNVKIINKEYSHDPMNKFRRIKNEYSKRI